MNIEKPDEYIETTTFAEGIDTQDKGSGKAMTYADKYALMKAYKISTGEDPDQTASEENNYSRKSKEKTPRERLIARLNEKGMNVKEYAKEKGLTGAVPDSRFEELLAELG